MIESLTLKNFKCYREMELPFQRLTVFAGVNSIGKSSAIQALVLMRQIRKGRKPCSPRHPGDPLCFRARRSDLALFCDLAAPDEELGVTVRLRDGQSVHLAGALQPEATFSLSEKSFKTAWFEQPFTYLNAERLGPREEFDMPLEHDHHGIGEQGEYAAYFLAVAGNQDIAVPALALPEASSKKIAPQTECWMQQIGLAGRIQLRATLYEKVRRVSLEYGIFDGTDLRVYAAQHVGFGLTYALPVFLAVLSTPAGSSIVIENPEAHLHPQAQVEMGVFLAKAAEAGIQIILETHSDHILNGIRLAVKNQAINHEHVKLHFIVRPNLAQGACSISPALLADGRIERWPEGFFDQYENTLMQLL